MENSADDKTKRFLTDFLSCQTDLRGYIGALVWDEGLREDIFQEVSLALWESYDRFDASRSFGAWARGVATKKILGHRRNSGRIPLIMDPEAIEAVMNAFDRTERGSTDREDALKHCLKRLPDRLRSLLTLRYGEGLRCEEIARRSRMTLDATYQALSRCRAQLEKCVTQRLQNS
ncbi:MAG: sigma-70 family RNA polymerase sigma factor [Verrucomicrobiales bacterium]|nr:sigma-70 family RNA polymerase sigma factor [Verrucomicrobiae bacterium]